MAASQIVGCFNCSRDQLAIVGNRSHLQRYEVLFVHLLHVRFRAIPAMRLFPKVGNQVLPRNRSDVIRFLESHRQPGLFHRDLHPALPEYLNEHDRRGVAAVVQCRSSPVKNDHLDRTSVGPLKNEFHASILHAFLCFAGTRNPATSSRGHSPIPGRPCHTRPV